MFRLAHVTDPHFRSFAGTSPGDFFNKRAAGAFNLLVNRRRKHRMELLTAMLEDLSVRPFDHMVVTGDLSNVSLESEWREALRWLRLCGTPDAITVIPGNHDVYVEEVVRRRIFETLFASFQTADVVRRNDEIYPFVRLRGNVALVAVNTAVPTGDLGAWGVIGAAQLGRLEGLLTAPEVASRFKVVLLHHPPVVHRPPENRNLRDRVDLVALFSRTGADLVLHGHDHRDERVNLKGPAGEAIPVVGLGSASYAGRPEHRARYNIYEIDGRDTSIVTYAHDESAGAFREVSRNPLHASGTT